MTTSDEFKKELKKWYSDLTIRELQILGLCIKVRIIDLELIDSLKKAGGILK